jgi:ribosome maturation factor RimP
VAKSEQLQALIEPAVRAVGFELWGIEYQAGGRTALLRVFIDGPEGVSVEDCARVSRQVSSVLDVNDPIRGEFTLEVSSPGLERNLYTPEQYRQYTGYPVKLRLRFPFEGQRRFSGVLGGVADGEVSLIVGEEEYLLPFESIERANIAGEPAQGKA